MVHPEDYPHISASVAEQIDASDDNMDYVEYRIIHKDGAVRRVDDYGHYLETDAYGGVYTVFISDITEKHDRIVSELEGHKATIDTLNETIGRMDADHLTFGSVAQALAGDYFSIYVVDPDTEAFVEYSSSEEYKNLGIEKHGANFFELSRRNMGTLIYPEDRERFMAVFSRERVLKIIKRDGHFTTKYRLMIDGVPTYVSMKAALLENRNERRLIIGLNNIDAQMKREEEFRKHMVEARTRAKNDFLANMSHDIRTPMNAIVGYTNIAKSRWDEPTVVADALDKIGSSSHFLLSLINDILDISKIESGKMQLSTGPCDLRDIFRRIEDITALQAKNKSIAITYMHDSVHHYKVTADELRIEQVLINITGNAIKYTPEGKSVELIAEELGATKDGKIKYRFVVRDTGIGMSKKFLPRIFDAFSQEDSSSTSRYGSTGLGMPITKSIVELMNGHIEVESEKGKGTVFTVTVTLGESDRKNLRTEEDDLVSQDMSVLVIDDDRIALEHAEIVLGQVGVSCDTAESGWEGVDKVRIRHGRREDYDLILIDWKMPKMDGIDTTRHIREIVGPDTPIIILTSFNWEEIADEAKEAGVDTFVSKPLFAENVMEEFREAFRRKQEALKDETADLKGRRVLLAEDVKVNAEIMMMVLAMREIESELAENGRIAVDLFESHESGYYDAILMDMRMPEMDGLEATRLIRASDHADAKSIPIIALTANAFDEDVQRSLQAGLNAHLSKPVEPERLFETLERLIK